jgi:GNAT superfamily N-acetyltransferase
MVWRLGRRDFEAGKGDGNRRALRELAEQTPAPGVLAYRGPTPIGWCAAATREAYPTLKRSRILKPIDELPVWSISCVLVDRKSRGQGISVFLLRAAVAFARNCGARVVEGYPVEPRQQSMPAVFAWTGIASAFLQAGFHEVARRSPTRPIMRIDCR